MDTIKLANLIEEYDDEIAEKLYTYADEIVEEVISAVSVFKSGHITIDINHMVEEILKEL